MRNGAWSPCFFGRYCIEGRVGGAVRQSVRAQRSAGLSSGTGDGRGPEWLEPEIGLVRLFFRRES